MNYAVIRNGLVENVVSWDGETDWTPPEGSDVVALHDRIAGPGWTYDGSTFTPPPAPEEELDDA